MNKTKAELEAELAELRIEVAGLRAAVEAYQYAFQHIAQPSYYATPAWDGIYRFRTTTVTI